MRAAIMAVAILALPAAAEAQTLQAIECQATVEAGVIPDENGRPESFKKAAKDRLSVRPPNASGSVFFRHNGGGPWIEAKVLNQASGRFTAAAFTGATFNTLVYSGVSMIWTRTRENAFMTGKPSGEVVYFDCR